MSFCRDKEDYSAHLISFVSCRNRVSKQQGPIPAAAKPTTLWFTGIYQYILMEKRGAILEMPECRVISSQRIAACRRSLPTPC